MDLSVVILTKNEEQNIIDCLESVQFADETLIIDDNSTDRTVELARHYGARVVTHSLNENFASQRNYAFNLIHGKWVFFVDADERVSIGLAEEIGRITQEKKSNINGYYLKREDVMWGRVLKHGETSNIKLIRLAKNGTGKWKGRVHEKWKIVGKTGELVGVIKHIPHPTISSFLKEIDRYTSLRAQELEETGIKANNIAIILYPIGKFILNYFIRRGYKDGIPGFLLTIMMSFHSFLVRGKLYLSRK